MSNELNKLSQSMAEAVETGGKSAVLVNGRMRMPATGIAIGKDLVLTANHAVRRDEEIQVVLPEGKSVEAKVLGRDYASDLALLKLAEESAEPAETNGEPAVGEIVFALGRPSTSGVQASLGIISAIGGPSRVRFGSLEKHYRVDAIPYPGFSGGPLINADGKVLGINTSHLEHGNLLTIPMDVALKIAESLEKYGGIRRGFLGIRSLNVDIVDIEDINQETGLLVESVDEGSPAANGGLMVGDIILSFNGEIIEEHFQLLAAMTGEVVGVPTDVKVLRGGKLETLQVTVDERKEQREGKHGHKGRRHGRDGHRRKDSRRGRRSFRHHGPPRKGFGRLKFKKEIRRKRAEGCCDDQTDQS